MNNDRECTGVCVHPKASELTAAQLWGATQIPNTIAQVCRLSHTLACQSLVSNPSLGAQNSPLPVLFLEVFNL